MFSRQYLSENTSIIFSTFKEVDTDGFLGILFKQLL